MRQEEAAAFTAFEPMDYTTPMEGYNVLPCPDKLPHDLKTGQKLARWFRGSGRHTTSGTSARSPR